MPVYHSNRAAGSRAYSNLPKRTLDYLAHGAQKGDRNNDLYFAAQQFKHAGYDQAQAESRLVPVAINDGLMEFEARKTVNSGYQSKDGDPIGGSNGTNPGGSQNFVLPIRRSPPPNGGSPPSMPEPISGGFRIAIGICFFPGEGIAISEITIDASGVRRPGPGEVLKQERWLERTATESIQQIYKDLDGLYIRINPMTFGGRSDKDVTSLRHVLVEFDLDENGNRIPKATQYQALLESGFPIAVIIDSGDKSIHGWIRVDAGTDFELYKQRREIVFTYFEPWNIDPKNKNPSRYSRAPEVARNLYDEDGNHVGIGQQSLINYNVGPVSWAEWEANQIQSERHTYEQILAFRTVTELPSVYPPELIKGVMYQGAKMSISGGSKMFKTWNLMHLLFCFANGLEYIGFQVAQGPVGLLDFELFGFDIRARFEALARVYRLQTAPFVNIHIATLRGEYLDFSDPLVQEVVAEKIRLGNLIAFALDPLYKALAGYDENSNSDVSRVLRPFEKLTVTCGASFLYNQHYSKGNQSSKDPIDRIAGAGGFGRDPDVLWLYTPHRAEDCFTVNIVQRSFAPIEPFVVRWKYPIFVRDDSVDPDDLAPPKRTGGRPAATGVDGLIMSTISASEDSGGITFMRLLAATAVSKATLHRHLKLLTAKGETSLSPVDKTYRLSPRNAAKWRASASI
jgi:RecA-family ATPase